jgi:gas vesicle protein
MKFLAAVVIVLLAINYNRANVLSDKVKEIGDDFKGRFTAMGNQLKDVGHALKDVAQDRFKGLLSQTLQALMGAVVNSIKGADVSSIIGKRDLAQLGEDFNALLKDAHDTLEEIFENTFGRFMENIRRIVTSDDSSPEEIQGDLDTTAALHSLAVRGVLSDTLNTGIDYLKNLYNKIKDGAGKLKDVLTGKPVLPGPIMISRRNILSDTFQSLKEKFMKLHEAVKPQLEKIHMITTDIASALGHHASNMLHKAGSDVSDKVQEIVATLSDHLANAKEGLKNFKDEVSKKVHSVLGSTQTGPVDEETY